MNRARLRQLVLAELTDRMADPLDVPDGTQMIDAAIDVALGLALDTVDRGGRAETQLRALIGGLDA